MQSTPSWAQGWERKKVWYRDHGYLNQVLTSEDGPDGGIVAKAIEATARRQIRGEA